MFKMNFPISLFRLLLASVFDASADAIKLKLAITYVKLAKNSRNLAIKMAFIIFYLVLLSIGLLMIPVALCLFMPWSSSTKAIVSISFAALYTIVPLISLMVAFSEKSWLHPSP